MRIRKELQVFGRGFARICETLGEDSQGFVRLWIQKIRKDLQGFARIRETLGEDLQGFRETLGEDSGDFGRGFA